jgi:predicted porin
MKKSLIALAVLSTIAGSAVAQSTVTVSGRMDVGISDKTLNPVAITPATSAVVTAGDLQSKTTTTSPLLTSFIRFSGSEDLGGGSKANFLLETNLTAAPSQFGDRGMWVEIENKDFGGLRVGNQNSISRDVWISTIQTGAINIVGDLNSSTAEDAGGTQGVNSFENAIKYTTPSFNGFRASAAMTAANVDTNGVKTGGDGSSFGLTYAAGKFNAIAGYSKQTTDVGAVTATTGAKVAADGAYTTITTAAGNTLASGEVLLKSFAAAGAAYQAKTEVTAVGATYDFGFARAGLTYVKREASRSNIGTTGAVDRESTTLSVNAPVGKASVFASYGMGDQVTAGNGYKGDLKAMQLGARYHFSKRTFGYVATGKVEQDLSATTKTDYKETAAGFVTLF